MGRPSKAFSAIVRASLKESLAVSKEEEDDDEDEKSSRRLARLFEPGVGEGLEGVDAIVHGGGKGLSPFDCVT